MTPAARVQAAIDCLDRIFATDAAEQVLTGWARSSRYAGSKDRAAVRDHVFDALRCRRSFAALGGGESGRSVMLGALRDAGSDPATLFTGEGHAPAPLSAAELAAGRAPEGAESADLPDWLWDRFRQSLGDAAPAAAEALRHRAPVHLRVNVARLTREDAVAALAQEGITSAPHPASPTALEVIEGARKLRSSRAYEQGLVELQDAASQAVVDVLPLKPGMRVLDFCAGGGGKTLAMAARGGLDLYAHDAAPQRLRGLEDRAARAGVQVTFLGAGDLDTAGPFDMVLCDAPCSGSGSWRRAPEAKWRLTPERLDELQEIQRTILGRASGLLTGDGILAYATCSVLREENIAQVEWFTSEFSTFTASLAQSWPVQGGTDGFFTAHLSRS